MPINNDEIINRFPNSAYIDAKGNYVADPVNTPLAYADRGAREMAPIVHTVRPGYCPTCKQLGCSDPSHVEAQ